MLALSSGSLGHLHLVKNTALCPYATFTGTSVQQNPSLAAQVLPSFWMLLTSVSSTAFFVQSHKEEV
jgi:hypothetical protein